ncbi:MAG: hypothetical protein WCA62_08405 [Dehalococcoidales bacterium]
MAENKKQPTAADLPPISKLINLVEYQDNAVVSKTLIDTKMETVTVFAFAAGQGLRSRVHNTTYIRVYRTFNLYFLTVKPYCNS